MGVQAVVRFNALFNLNPFLALDGYYLLMDAVEVPNLRTRGLAWVAARLRRRPPRFGELDGEGRLVALYGMLAVVWLVIAVNLAYRVYTDRVTGLVTGLWRSGWPARVLLVAVVAVLTAPIVYAGIGWLGKRWRRLLERLAERRVGADAPRRLRALQGSALGNLSTARLTELAAQARWVRGAPASSSSSPAPRSPTCMSSSRAPWKPAAPATRPARSASGSALAEWWAWPTR